MREAELLFIKSCRENKPRKVHAYLTLAQDLEIDVNAVDALGRTAAYWAAQAGHTEVIRILASTGLVDWNKADRSGFTPLHGALYGKHFDVAGIIVKQGNVNFSVRTIIGRTLPLTAVIGGSVRCVEILAERQDCDSWNIPDNNGDTPLMEAIRWEKRDILQVLLNCPRVDPNFMDQDGNSPLMMAIKEKKTAMARLMIKCPRVDLSARDSNGATLQRIARWEETKINLNFELFLLYF